MQTIDKVLSTRNLTEACAEVVKNKGAGGIDGMNVKQLKSYLDKNREELCSFIREGMYIPQPIRGKEIPKRNGKKKRKLGIPTGITRWPPGFSCSIKAWGIWVAAAVTIIPS